MSTSTSSLTPKLARLLALCCGMAIASAYYAQPLLPEIGQSLGMSVADMGLIPMLTQIGVGLGVLLFLPLGDVLDNRKLIVALLSAHAVALVLVATAESGTTLAVASALLGLSTVVPYLLPPMAARLSDDSRRGQVTGLLASGIFGGILLSRTVSGYLGYVSGWRSIYWLAIGLTILMAALLYRRLGSVAGITPSGPGLRYPDLLRSLATVFRQEPSLRRAALTQGLIFGGFNAFWVTLSFHLQSPSFQLPSYVAGLFGVIGVAGAFAAPLFGRLADQRGPVFAVRMGTAMAAAGWLLFAGFGYHLAGLIMGVVLLDLGVTASHVANQTIIYRLAPALRSRISTLYILGAFTGGALLSRLSTLAYAHAHWFGVSMLGLAVSTVALLVNLLPRPQPHAEPCPAC